MRRAATEPWAERDLNQMTGLAPSAVGYLIDWRDSASPALLYDLLEIGANATAEELSLPKRKPFGTASDEYAFTLVRGAILQGELDVTHPLGFGYASSQLPVFRTSNRFMNHSANPYSTPLAYATAPLLSGYMSSENQDVVANSAGLVVDQRGEGAVVLSLDSPTFRAFWWGTQRLLVNGIFFGDLLEEPR